MLKERTLNEETKKDEGWGKPLAKVKNNSQLNNKNSTNSNTLVVSVSKQNKENPQKLTNGTPSTDNEEQKRDFSSQQISYNKLIQENEIKVTRQMMFGQKDIYKSVPVTQKTDAEFREEVGKKLICEMTKIDIFDPSQPVLGYYIFLQKDMFGRILPSCSLEMFSDQAYRNYTEDQNMGNDAAYRYWLPVYINQEHFERGRQYILNTIAMIATGSKDQKNNEFHPSMILKVLPAILVRIIVNFLQTKTYETSAIETYCQYYQLLVKLIDMFPELRATIDQEVEAFCLKEENRHKKQLGDLGEFVVKLALSTKGLNDPDINNLLLRECLARRALWASKADNDLKCGQDCPNLIERFMTATKVANQLFLIQLEAAKLLLDDSIKAELEERFGLLDSGKMKMFMARLGWIQKNVVKDWRVYIEGIGQQGYVCNDEIMTTYIQKAFNMARNKGYMS